MARRLKARRAEKAANEERPGEHIVRHVASLGDGTYIIEHPDGRLERRKSETDWARFDAITDEEIEASIADDPDWQEFKDIDWSKAVLVIPPKKKAISIRVDEDVLDYFKAGRRLPAAHERGAALVHAAETPEARLAPTFAVPSLHPCGTSATPTRQWPPTLPLTCAWRGFGVRGRFRQAQKIAAAPHPDRSAIRPLPAQRGEVCKHAPFRRTQRRCHHNY